MESDLRFFSRRAYEEAAAARRAVTPQARQRRLELADEFARKARALASSAATATAEVSS